MRESTPVYIATAFPEVFPLALVMLVLSFTASGADLNLDPGKTNALFRFRGRGKRAAAHDLMVCRGGRHASA